MPQPMPAESSQRSPARDDELDRRVAAVLEVLAGTSAAVVAERRGVEVELVGRWLDEFMAGGRDRLAGRVATHAESRDRLLAMTSHEFLTPLTIVKGWAETLLDAPDIAPELRSVGLDAISRQAKVLERIARDLLDSAAVAVGRFRLLLRDVDVARVVVEVVAAMGDERVQVRPSPPIAIVADPDRITQVLVNLLDNAMRHGADGPIDVELIEEVDHVEIVVRNVGSIDPDEAYELFEPWVREEGSGGRGLGLYVCRALVVAHGGHIGVRGDDTSTEFWFRLPLAGPPPAMQVGHAENEQGS